MFAFLVNNGGFQNAFIVKKILQSEDIKCEMGKMLQQLETYVRLKNKTNVLSTCTQTDKTISQNVSTQIDVCAQNQGSQTDDDYEIVE